MNDPSPNITIKTKTWSRDSHGLFDYESKNVLSKRLQTQSTCGIGRYDSNVQLVSTEFYSVSDQCQYLATFTSQNNQFRLESSEAIWLISKQMQQQGDPGYLLSQGDTIKLGRVCLKVKQLRGLNDDDSGIQTQDSQEEEIPNQRQSGTCRVCLGDDSLPDNPLITPCICSGSVQYIHLECLQMWINSRKVLREGENSISSYWKTMDCELCKHPYPLKINNNGTTHDLFHKEHLITPFVILEVENRDRNNGLHMISLINKFQVKLGRGHESDIRISDISVSRLHATIHYVDGKFYLEDNNSKFGSLIQSQGRLNITDQRPLCVQIGRTVLQFQVGNEFERQDTYYQQMENKLKYCFKFSEPKIQTEDILVPETTESPSESYVPGYDRKKLNRIRKFSRVIKKNSYEELEKLRLLKSQSPRRPGTNVGKKPRRVFLEPIKLQKNRRESPWCGGKVGLGSPCPIKYRYL